MSEAVGRGTLLSGRYRVLQRAESDVPGAEGWQATDQILDRAVRVQVLTSGAIGPALDGARRAALIADPRLVRVLDVGSHEGIGFVVHEQVSGPSLADLVARGPLSADQARAVVGEAAAALEAARRRGVHHLALRPATLHVSEDGRVLVSGLALDAALLGVAEGDARTTSRRDTVALVRLLYAALTGRWPADPRGAPFGTSLPEAPVVDGAPVPPGELAAGVPNDLDTLCVVTLGPYDDGPHSPGDLVRELEPWGEVRALGVAAGGAAAGGAAAVARTAGGPPPAPSAGAPDPESVDTAPVSVQRQSVRSAFDDRTSPGSNRPGTPPPAAPVRSSAFGAAAGGMLPPPVGSAPLGSHARGGPSAAAAAGAAGAGAAGSGAGAAAPDAPGAGAAGPAASGDPGAAHVSGPSEAATGAGVVALGGAASAAAPRAVGPEVDETPTASLPPVVDEPGAPFDSPVVAPTATAPLSAAPDTAAPPVPTPPAGVDLGVPGAVPPGTDPGWPAGVPSVPGSGTPLAFGAPQPGGVSGGGPFGEQPTDDPFDFGIEEDDTPTRRRFDPTALVLLVVGVVVVIGVILAFNALFSSLDLGAPEASGSTSTSTSAPPSQEPTEPTETTSEPAVPTGPPPVIASATTIDPSDDDGEHQPEAGRAFDGDTSTYWYTLTYQSADFAGFKDAVGYVMTLDQPATVSSVTLRTGSTGGKVEIRASDASDPGGGTLLASGEFGPEVTFELDPPTETETLTLWITELPTAADGAFRLELNEITLS